MIRIGKHHNVELFEYDAPVQQTVQPRNSDIGGHHMGFYVDDIDAAYDYVRAIPGVVVQEGPNGVDPRRSGGRSAVVLLPVPVGHAARTDQLCPDGFYRGTARCGHGAAEQDMALTTAGAGRDHLVQPCPIWVARVGHSRLDPRMGRILVISATRAT